MENQLTKINESDFVSADALQGLHNPSTNMMCSIEDDGTRASKVKIYNAISNAEKQLVDFVNNELLIVDVVAHTVTLLDQNGVPNECVRTILIDNKGVGYQAVSGGVVSSLQRIFAIVGMPSWRDEPVKIVPKQVKTQNGKSVLTLTLKI